MGRIGLKEFKKQEQAKQEESNKSDKEFVSPLLKLPTLNKGEKFSFKVRILPDFNEDNTPRDMEDGLFFIKNMQHKGYWNKETKQNDLFLRCPVMFGKDCPLCSKGDDGKTLISKIYKLDQDVWKQVKRRTNFIVNVYVIENSEFPEQEGTVKRMYCHDKLIKALMDEMEDVDDPKDILNINKEGLTVKFVIEKTEWNEWTTKVLPTNKNNPALDISDKIDFDSFVKLDVLYDGFLDKMPDYIEWNNQFSEILENKTSGLGLKKIEPKIETKSETTVELKIDTSNNIVSSDDLKNLQGEL